MAQVRLVVVPIFRRHWLFYVSATGGEGGARPGLAAKEIPRGWGAGLFLEERMQRIADRIHSTLRQRVVKMWSDLEKAREGTMMNRMYRLAQSVLSREDPQEGALRAIPPVVKDMEIMHPASVPEALVRRRLMLMARERLYVHQRGMIGWGLLLTPLLPILITPAPNFPIYYAVYRLYSHYKARGGCKAICSGLDHLRAQQIEAMRLRLLDMEKTGHVFPNGSWAARVLRDDKGYFDLLERANTYRQEKPLEWVPRFVASATLEEIVQPAMRMRRPLPDEAAMKLGQQLEIPGLMEYVARARRRAVGSMFPTSVE